MMWMVKQADSRIQWKHQDQISRPGLYWHIHLILLRFLHWEYLLIFWMDSKFHYVETAHEISQNKREKGDLCETKNVIKK